MGFNKDPGFNLLKEDFQKFQVAHGEFPKLIALDRSNRKSRNLNRFL